ncbi:nucleotide exchange factor GrpE [Mycolicibacterium wolinskyi]|uniref:Protein GrpE n=1 Tax=Mycolicibacterium wolinskyi TaxID=59750 RepID=A0A1X2FAL6_9MYCO|nr:MULTISPECIES: nucleotide exchange factor GrpE [Mycolicibacterium]MCV7285246.1 nucleotide exchange factor GrpE [Mycolicibacterium wolinskyi]MCV7291057.1 nucleotide exchange factor GrpE [Mycolicibacterium goodii]ORX15019.1 molecular chaperone GrpE [Mycolicibacterium wolinskyi]
MSQDDSHEPVTITDKRRIDPETGEVREPEPAPGGPAPAASGAAESAGDSDEVAELKATLQRVKAEYDNYRKRALRDQQLTADRTKAAVVTQLLGILDDLDRARSHGDLESGPLKSVADKLVNALEGLGLSGFGEEGDEFDPSLHEAVQHEGEGTHPIVGTVMRRGYKVGEQVVRHALVGVVDTVPDAEAADNPDATGAQAAESDK